MHTTDLANEWSILQNQYDSYEKYSLLIKLLSIILLSCTIFLDRADIFIGILLLILWTQDAIWKTFQSRIETRLLCVENCLSNPSPEITNKQIYQFNSQYLQSRPGNLLLIIEYIKQAIKPTIAFPHIILLLVISFKILS